MQPIKFAYNFNKHSLHPHNVSIPTYPEKHPKHIAHQRHPAIFNDHSRTLYNHASTNNIQVMVIIHIQIYI